MNRRITREMLRGVARAKKDSRIWAWYSRRSGRLVFGWDWEGWDGRGGMPLVSSTGVATGVRTVVVT